MLQLEPGIIEKKKTASFYNRAQLFKTNDVVI